MMDSDTLPLPPGHYYVISVDEAASFTTGQIARMTVVSGAAAVAPTSPAARFDDDFWRRIAHVAPAAYWPDDDYLPVPPRSARWFDKFRTWLPDPKAPPADLRDRRVSRALVHISRAESHRHKRKHFIQRLRAA